MPTDAKNISNGHSTTYGWNVKIKKIGKPVTLFEIAWGSEFQTFAFRWTTRKYDFEKTPHAMLSLQHNDIDLELEQHCLLTWETANALAWFFLATARAEYIDSDQFEIVFTKHKLDVSFTVEHDVETKSLITSTTL